MSPETAHPLFLFYDHAKRELRFGDETAQLSYITSRVFNALYSSPRKRFSNAELLDAARLSDKANVNISLSFANAAIARLTQGSGVDHSIKNIYGANYFDPTPFTITKIYEATKHGVTVRVFEDDLIGPIKDRVLLRLNPDNHDHTLVLDTNLQRLYHANKFVVLSARECALAQSLMNRKNEQTREQLLGAIHTGSASAFHTTTGRIRNKIAALTSSKVKLVHGKKQDHTAYKFAAANFG